MAQPRACEQVVRIGVLTTKGGEKQKDGTALSPSASAYYREGKGERYDCFIVARLNRKHQHSQIILSLVFEKK